MMAGPSTSVSAAEYYCHVAKYLVRIETERETGTTAPAPPKVKWSCTRLPHTPVAGSEDDIRASEEGSELYGVYKAVEHAESSGEELTVRDIEVVLERVTLNPEAPQASQRAAIPTVSANRAAADLRRCHEPPATTVMPKRGIAIVQPGYPAISPDTCTRFDPLDRRVQSAPPPPNSDQIEGGVYLRKSLVGLGEDHGILRELVGVPFLDQVRTPMLDVDECRRLVEP